MHVEIRKKSSIEMLVAITENVGSTGGLVNKDFLDATFLLEVVL